MTTAPTVGNQDSALAELGEPYAVFTTDSPAYGPAVYVCLDANGAVQYIGKTTIGFGRPFNRCHEVFPSGETWTVKFWPMPDGETALSVEKRLIEALQPPHNTLGLTPGSRQERDERERCRSRGALGLTENQYKVFTQLVNQQHAVDIAAATRVARTTAP